MEPVVLAIVFVGGWIVTSLAFTILMMRRKEIENRQPQDGASEESTAVSVFIEDEDGVHADDSAIMG